MNPSEPRDGWQASGVQLAGLLKRVRAQGLETAVLEKCSPATRAAFQNPYATTWHAGPLLAEFSMALVRSSSTALFEQLNYEMARDSFGPIVGSLMQVAMAVFGRSPATLLSKLGQAAGQGLRGVPIVWTAQGERGGELRITYPGGIEKEVEFAWRGVLRFLGELAKTPITVKRVDIDGGAFEFQLEW